MTIDRRSPPTPGKRRRREGYVGAIAAVAAIAALRFVAEPVVHDRALFLPFVLAVAIAAWIGGTGPAALATLLGAAAAVAIGVDTGSLVGELQQDLLGLVLFVLVSAVVTLPTVQLVTDRERARRNEARATQLHRVSNAVARGLPPEEVARVVLREGLEALGAGSGVVGTTSPDGATVSVIASSGYRDTRIDAYRTFGIADQLPMSEAIRLREPIIIPTAEELRSRYPALADAIADGGSSVVLPLLYEDEPVGALYFRFDDVRSFDADDRAYFLTLGRQCAAALVRARLAEAERRATAGLALLVRAGAEINASLDVDETVGRACRLVVPELADWSAVHLVEPDGSIRLIEVCHPDADRAARARASGLGRPGLEDERGVGAVIRTGRVEHAEELAPELASRMLEDPGWREAAGGILPRAYAIAPLVARGRVLGSLSIVTDSSGRAIGAAERQLAEQLAERAAMAIDNARLYRELASREARRSAIARLGQRAMDVAAAPESLAADAARELVTAVRGVEEAAVLERVGDGIRVAGKSSVAAGTAFASLPGAEDPAVARTLAEGGPIVSGRSVLARISTSAGPWGLVVVGGTSVEWSIEALESVAEVAAVLGEAFDRVRRLEEERRTQELGRAFIGVVSHELRTPITTIYAGAKLLRRTGSDERERREIAGDIEAEADRLYRLTEDLLVLTRLERNDLEIGREPVLVSRLAERVVASERVHWPLVAFELRVPPMLPTAVGEDIYVEQVLRNLVGNAAKYSPAHSTVEIEATTADDEIVVRVLDRGPGVSAADRDRLFSLFYRSPATASQASGAGIGLFVCEQLVRAMGGRLWARPRPGGGSEFGFALQPYLDVDDEVIAPPKALMSSTDG